MLVTQQEQLRADVTALVDKLGPGRSSLIPILQDVKRRHHGIDTDAMQIVADLLDIHPVEVYSVATFYAFLSPRRAGRVRRAPLPHRVVRAGGQGRHPPPARTT